MKPIAFKCCAVFVGLVGAAYASPPANLISNGGFEDGITGWTEFSSFSATDSAQATRTIDSTSNSAREGKAFHRITVSSVSSEFWKIQLKTPKYRPRTGYVYTYSFWARADTARIAHIIVYKDKSGSDIYHTGSTIALTPEWKKYNQQFLSYFTGYEQISFSFVCGSEIGVYDLDDVKIDEMFNQGGLYLNGGFEAGNTGWYLFVSSDSSSKAAATISFPSEGAPEGDLFARITVTSITSPELDWHIILFDGSWNAAPNTEYRFSFQARADSIRPIRVEAMAGMTRDFMLLGEQRFTLTRQWQHYSYTYCQDYYDAVAGIDSLNFVIHCGGSTGIYDFDAISLVIPTSTDKVRPTCHTFRKPMLQVRPGSERLYCTAAVGAASPSIISIIDISGRIFSTFTIAPNSRAFDLPRPPGGTWILRVNNDYSRKISIP